MRGRFAATYGRLAGITVVLVVLCFGMPSAGRAGDYTQGSIFVNASTAYSRHEGYVARQTSPDFSLDNRIAFDGTKVYPTPHLDQPPIYTLKAGTDVKLVGLCQKAVRLSAGKEHGFYYFVYEIVYGGNKGFVRAIDILRFVPDERKVSIIRNTVGCVDGWWGDVAIDSYWLRNLEGNLKFIGTGGMDCIQDEVSWSRDGSFFFCNASNEPNFYPIYAPKIYSSSGEVIFDNQGCDYKKYGYDGKACFDSPTWLDDETVLLRLKNIGDAVYSYNAKTGKMKKFLELGGEQAGYQADDCDEIPGAVEYDKDKKQVKVVFLRRTNNDEDCGQIDEITVTCDMGGRIISQEKATTDNQ